MKVTKVPASERIASSFKQLSTASEQLNIVTSDFANTIAPVDAALGSLKLGVSAWHKVAGADDPRTGDFWHRDIGYSKFGNDWGIALRRVSGNEFADDGYHEEIWRFAGAPPWMCVEAAGKLPDLIDDLIQRTHDTTKNLKAKTIEVR